MTAVASREIDPAPASHALDLQQLDQQQFLTFMLGGEVLAIGILAIKEIIEFGEVRTVPMMPTFVRGVINLRGAVVPVVDLGARFGKQETAATRRSCIVIVEVENEQGGRTTRQDVGVMVDAVNEVLEITADQIEPAPALGSRMRTEFIRGMGKVDGKFVVILDTDHVLSVADLPDSPQAVAEELNA